MWWNVSSSYRVQIPKQIIILAKQRKALIENVAFDTGVKREKKMFEYKIKSVWFISRGCLDCIVGAMSMCFKHTSSSTSMLQ